MRRGLALVEVLLAAGLLAALGGAVLLMTGQSVDALRVDRVRMGAEELCRATVERFGRGEDNLQARLSPSVEAGVLTGENLWEQMPEVYAAMGFPRAAEQARRDGLAMKVRLRRGAEPGLDVLTCEVAFRATRLPERVVYTRFLLHDHVH